MVAIGIMGGEGVHSGCDRMLRVKKRLDCGFMYDREKERKKRYAERRERFREEQRREWGLDKFFF